MKSLQAWRRVRSLLLMSCATMLGSGAIAAPHQAARDLGAIAASMPVTATIWLRPHDEAGLDDALSRSMTPGSATYHRWISVAELATHDATGSEADGLATALRQAGLRVTMQDGDTGLLRVTGTAAAIGAAFRTELHGFEHNGRHFYAATREPRFAGAHADLIAGITGLTNARMTPFVLHQLDFATGKPVPMRPAGVVDPNVVYTDHCFIGRKVVKFGRFSPGGANHVDLVGPKYAATGSLDAPTCGYSPYLVARHYGLSAVYAQGLKGDGETIVLVDAYGSPTIQSDANLFSSKTGLPKLTAKNFKVVYPDGPPVGSPYGTGWPDEISLDVEWAHAMAPNAKLVLVVAPSDDDSELAYALHYAVKNQLGDVIFNSYGYPEADFGPAAARAFNVTMKQAAATGISVFVATGDSGDEGLGTPIGAASIPADSPFATGVGGTSLNLPSDNGPVEAVWGITVTFLANLNFVSNPPSFEGFQQGGGGGESVYFKKPSWQSALPGTGRQLPDVSAIADPQTGAVIVAPTEDGTQTVAGVIGGTSLASPVMAGIWALADEAAHRRLGQAAPIISTMHTGAVTDIQPIVATQSNLQGIVGGPSMTAFYSPAALLDLSATQPNGSLGTSVSFGLDVLYDLGFGSDSSLMAASGWDNGTGYGVPNGLSFIKAAARAR